MRHKINARLIVKGGQQTAIEFAQHHGLKPEVEDVLERESYTNTILLADGPERALYEWFNLPGIAPFEDGTLLHFSILDDAVEAVVDNLECGWWNP